MSYARFDGRESEVYVIATGGGMIECLGCRITGDPSSDGIRYGYFAVNRPEFMLEHLLEHREQGWKVPEYALERLKREVETGQKETVFCWCDEPCGQVPCPERERWLDVDDSEMD